MEQLKVKRLLAQMSKSEIDIFIGELAKIMPDAEASLHVGVSGRESPDADGLVRQICRGSD